MRMRTRKVPIAIGLLLAAAALIGAYWYWSPYWDIRRMVQAAEAGDADRFSAHVDYPRLRESLKTQFAARMASETGKVDPANPFAGMGAKIGLGIANAMVDALVRPQVVMRAFKEGRISPRPGDAPDPAPPQTRAPPQPEGETGVHRAKEPRWEFDRQGANKIVAYMNDPQDPAANREHRLAVVFERTGFANWKLTELRLPQ
jgi:hypothetical protein